jgi:hypothetical protein
MAVHEGLDVDDDLLAHIDAALVGRRAHMRQEHHLALAGELDEPRADRGLLLEHVEAGRRDLAALDQSGQRVLVDHLAAGSVDHDRLGLEQLEPPRRQEVVGRRRVRTVDRHDVDPCQHLVEGFPVGGVERALDRCRDPAPVVVVDLKAESPGALGQRLADPPHADDAEALTGDPSAEHPGRRPSGGPLVVRDDARAFGDPAGHGEDQRHRHVGGVLGQHAGRVCNRDAPLQRRRHVDVIDAVSEIGDQPKVGTGLGDQPGIDLVGHGGDKDVGLSQPGRQSLRRHRRVFGIEPDVEQLTHPRLDGIRQAPRHDHQRLALRHVSLPVGPAALVAARARRLSPGPLPASVR